MTPGHRSTTDQDEPRAVARLVGELSQLPGVEAVALGGSRAAGTHHDASDWDFGVYYRGDRFRPADVRALGHPGTVVELGEWGGGVFNGGAWLQVDGVAVDLLWRDLDVVDHEIAEARAGRWRLEPLMFHLAGIPTYLLLAELAVNRVRHGTLPRPGYPPALREVAGRDWARRADLTLAYASSAHAAHGRTAACLGLVAVGAAEYAPCRRGHRRPLGHQRQEPPEHGRHGSRRPARRRATTRPDGGAAPGPRRLRDRAGSSRSGSCRVQLVDDPSPGWPRRMTWATYGSFLVFATVLVLVPGPDFAVVVKNTLSGGRRRGWWATVGVVSANAVQGVAAATGLGALITASQPLFEAIRWAGTAYLALLAVQAIRSAVRGVHAPLEDGQGTSRGAALAGWRQGFLSHITNPKVLVFYLAVLPQFLGPEVGLSVLLASALSHAALSLLHLTLLVLGLGRARRVLGRRPVRRALDALTGVALLGFGARLATDRRACPGEPACGSSPVGPREPGESVDHSLGRDRGGGSADQPRGR